MDYFFTRRGVRLPTRTGSEERGDGGRKASAVSLKGRREGAETGERHSRRKPALIAARKMYPERCISVSDSSGSTSIDAMHG